MPSPATAQALIDSLGGLVTVVPQLKNELGTLTAGAKQSGDGAKAGASAFQALTALMGPVGEAVNVVKGSFDSLAGTLRPFVEAFSPSAVLVFDQAMRDLSAVIGSAVLPVFNVLTGVVQQVGAILLPVFQQLQPVIQEVAGVFAQLAGNALENFGLLLAPLKMAGETFAQLLQALLPLSTAITKFGGMLISLGAPLQALVLGVVQMIAGTLSPLMAAIDLLTPVFEGVTVLMQGVAAAVRGIISALVFNFGLRDALARLRDAIERTVTSILLYVARLAKALGADEFVQGMIDALGGGRRSAQGFGAPRDAHVGSDVMGFDRELRALAVTATGVGKLSDEDRRHKELVAELQRIAKNTDRGGSGTTAAPTIWGHSIGAGTGAFVDRAGRVFRALGGG
jgi:hypothetical protein